MLELAEAIQMVSRLDRTINFPREKEAIKNLARGLIKASEMVHVDAGRIVERCAEISQYCPTDADMLAIARDLRGPQQFRPTDPTKCPKCNGTGWEIVYMLHTYESGKHNFTRKERITEARANDLWPKIDTRKQMIYSGAKRCHCPIPSAPMEFPKDDPRDRDWARRAAGDEA